MMSNNCKFRDYFVAEYRTVPNPNNTFLLFELDYTAVTNKRKMEETTTNTTNQQQQQQQLRTAELRVLHRADGSASFCQGNTVVWSSVYGPADCAPNKRLLDKAALVVGW